MSYCSWIVNNFGEKVKKPVAIWGKFTLTIQNIARFWVNLWFFCMKMVGGHFDVLVQVSDRQTTLKCEITDENG